MRVRAWLACANTCYTGTAFTGLVLSIDQCLFCFVTYGSSHPSFSFLILWNLVNRPTKFKKKNWNWVCHGRLNTLYLVMVSDISPKEGFTEKQQKRKVGIEMHPGIGLIGSIKDLQIWMIWYSFKFIGFIILYANFSTLFIKFTFCLFMGFSIQLLSF